MLQQTLIGFLNCFCRDQYAVALKNANDSLEQVKKQLSDLDSVRIENERLESELAALRQDSGKAVEVASILVIGCKLLSNISVTVAGKFGWRLFGVVSILSM